MNNFILSLNSVLPVFLIIVLGIFLKKRSILDDTFVSKSSKLVFKVTLPVLIFKTISEADFLNIYNGKVVLLVILIVTLGFTFIYFLTGIFIKDGASRASFIQGAFRSNTAIVGLAIISNLYGESGLTKAALPIVFIFPMYNIYSVLALTLPLNSEGNNNTSDMIKSIITNPLIIAVIIALPFSLFTIQPPGVFSTFLGYLSRMTLPLALLGVGASLNFHSFKKNMLLALSSSIIKLIIFPLFTILALLFIGIKGQNFGVLFILMGCPTAISSYVMADAMGADKELAAAIILITTLGSILTIGLGIFILNSLHLI